MAVTFDGTYRLKPLGVDNIPIRKWTDAWRVRIIDLPVSRPDLLYLRPRIVVAVRTGVGTLRTTCAESLGKRICRDFDLDSDEILWVEQLPDQREKFYVATFVLRPHMPEMSYDSVEWRPIRPNEFCAIERFIPEIAESKTSEQYGGG